jgi:hypothetical protein
MCSFVDRDMLLRHFGHGVGHFQYQRQPEFEPDIAAEGDDDDNAQGETEEREEDFRVYDEAQDEVEPDSDPGISEEGGSGGEDDAIDVVDGSSDSDDSEPEGEESDGYASY